MRRRTVTGIDEAGIKLVASNAVEFLIHALRRKLGADAIRNVRGVGWLVAKDA